MLLYPQRPTGSVTTGQVPMHAMAGGVADPAPRQRAPSGGGEATPQVYIRRDSISVSSVDLDADFTAALSFLLPLLEND